MVNAGLNSVHDWLTTDKLTLDTKKKTKIITFRPVFQIMRQTKESDLNKIVIIRRRIMTIIIIMHGQFKRETLRGPIWCFLELDKNW